WEIESQVKTVLSKLGLTDLNKTVAELSGGLRRRVQLAQVLLGNADLLLLDEPTNHLDIDTIEWLTTFLKNTKKSVLFITHDRYFLDNVATRIFELDRASLTEYQGNYQDYVRLKAEQDERDAALRHKKEQLYKQELAWMRRQPQARATKQQARINRFHDLKGDLANKIDDSELEINFETSRIGKKVINFENVSFSYPDKPILKDFNLLIQNKDRIGIVGDNGKGKSTLLNLIAGDLQAYSGKVDIGETIRIGYFSQTIKGLDESKRVINFLQEVAEEAKTTSGMVSIAELLEQFLFPRNTHGTLIEKLSGGEKKRLYLLKILLQRPNVLLLDEPTNDLDIATLTVLEHFLQGFTGPVITVSHDRYFLDKVANKILAFEDSGIETFFGNYTDYLDEKAFLASSSAISLEKPKEKTEKIKENKKRMSYFEKQEWATIEEDIAGLEERIATIEAEMLTCGSDFTKLSDLQKELDKKNDLLLEKYERYEYLSELEG
ncbi:TPA: ABC-F family ATP-binding cassette domain-containing protein, partial [Streptococcus suis]|nr:ABC-F family ATP-binding cassette domain-containing protein [Streptococcus suis]